MTVYRILPFSGLNRSLQKSRVKRTYTRWQRRHSNTKWQCDLKFVDVRWLITILDDRSGFVTASRIFKELDRAVHECAKPREILTDNSSQFLGSRRGESCFDVTVKAAIKHILGGIGKPTTLGKIERWFQTYDLEHTKFPLHRKFVE